MELINVKGNEELVKSIIMRKGYAAEHHLYCYIYNTEPNEENILVKFDDRGGILTKYNKSKSEWNIFSGIVADENDRLPFLMEFIEYAFSKGVKKVCVEFEEKFRKKVIGALKETEYKACPVNCTLVWPVFEMKKWNGNLMQGKEWKDIRYWWNRFFREHKVEFKTAADVDTEVMMSLLMKWKKQRTTGDRTYTSYYTNIINGGFKDYNTRVIFVDGKIASVTAGFKIPNMNYYYSSIGIYDRDFDHMGEIANMDDLIELKRKGYDFVDFGGGEESLTSFKNKFKPSYHYKTQYFSIVMKISIEKNKKKKT